MALEASSFERRLKYRGAVSRPVDTVTAILAGSGAATDLLYLVLLDPVDRLIAKHSRLRVFMVADDLTLRVEGGDEGEVAEYIDGVTRDCVEELEGQLGMTISRDAGGRQGKTVALASSGAARRKVEVRLRKYGIRVKLKVRNLGVDFSMGKRQGKGTGAEQRLRTEAAARKTRRAGRLGTSAAPLLVKGAAAPSILYGTIVTGITDQACEKLRVDTARTYGLLQGRSVTARLLMENNDPGLAVVKKPVMAWAEGVWDSLLTADQFHQAWKFAAVDVGLSTRPNARIFGGSGAMWAALKRLGWSAPSHHSFKTRDGTVLYFGDAKAPAGTVVADPRTVAKYVDDDYEQVVLQQSQLARDLAAVAGMRGYPRAKPVHTDTTSETQGQREPSIPAATYGQGELERAAAETWRHGRYECNDLGPIPWLWPIARVAASARRNGRRTAAASLRSLVEGGWWTQRKLWAQGCADHDRCLCGEAAGTLWHRLGECRMNEERRKQACPQWILRLGKASVWDPLFSRGVSARPRLVKVPSAAQWYRKAHDQQDNCATGIVFTDGSAKGPFWRMTRGGWAAVCFTADQKWSWTLSGTMAEPHTSSYRAELKALLETLRRAAPPLTIYSDNKAVVAGVSRGEARCTNSKCEAADLWKDIWFYLEQLGPHVHVEWTKGHAKWHHVLAGKTTLFRKRGNDMADAAANEARRAEEREAPSSTFASQIKRATAWARWIVSSLSSWQRDIDPKQKEDLRASRLRTKGLTTGGTGRGLPHEIWADRTSLQCRRCAREAPREADHKPFLMEACRGSAAGRALAASTGNINYIWHRMSIGIKRMVSKGGRVLPGPAIPESCIDAERLDELAQGDEQRRRDILLSLGLPGSAQQVPMTHGDEERHSHEAPPAKRNKTSATEGVEVHGTAAARGIKRQREQDPELEPEYVMPWEREPDWMPAHLARRTGREQASAAVADDVQRGGDSAAHSSRRRTSEKRKSGHWQASSTHELADAGPLIFCMRCARYANRRFGAGLKGPCQRPTRLAQNSVAARLRRLFDGKHPITGEALE